MKKYKWILLLIVLAIFLFEMSWRLEQYYNHNRWKNKTSTEIQNMISRIETKNSKEVLNLWNYYLVRDESDNYYLTICFMKNHLKEEKLFVRRVEKYENGGKFKLEECPITPLHLIQDNNTFWDKVEAWFLYQLGQWVYNN